MATGGDSGDPVYTPETALGLRLMALITDEGTTLLRRVFVYEVCRMTPCGKSLQEHLESNRDVLYRQLNREQKKLVYPSGVANSADKFDITLLCLLFDKLCKSTTKTDNMDLVTQLRQFRNKNHAHIKDTALSQGEFDQLWKELSDILLGLGRIVNTVAENKILESRITKRKEQPIESELAKKYEEEFEDFYRRDNEVKDLVVAQGQKQSEEIKTTVKETIKEELKEWQKPTVAEEAKPSSEGPFHTFEKLRNYLQDRYRRELAKIRPLPWCEDFHLNQEDMFTTLEMVCRDGLKNDTAVAVEDMFKSFNDKVPPKTIRVEGDPGIGKTTLCYKIVYDCSAEESKFHASNKFSSFKLVLYVEMRNCKVPKDTTNIDVKSTIFKQVFPEAYYKHEEEFWNYVISKPEDVLFVLDGLDEMPEATRETLKIADFIRGQIIPGVHVIVTSRPYHCNKQLKSCDRHFVIKGYSHENIDSYIHKHPKLDSSSEEGMLQQLNENDSLHQLTKNPLNLALLFPT
ncbi:nucleotide-binding oligomerization domain-containing protein 1-like [Branchiostoma lanceolatum]|uniref:nucleotide-binding oligomerization domain-containing protein 1-like n=1 Tax=Branchiostoma lanceolatum TaxID=7740 RepID=UPI00345533B0